MKGIKNETLKFEAIKLRRRGYSYPMIEKKLGTPRATLSGWFKSLKLPLSARHCILDRKRKNLEKLREKALLVLKQAVRKRRQEIDDKVAGDFFNFDLDVQEKELLLAMLYLGEGFKKCSVVGLGNSNPEIAALFVKLLRDIYNVEDSKLRCFLHLRMDQDAEVEKSFWSKQLAIPEIYFRKSQFDKRTINSKTWKNYHGVCIVYYYDAKIEKRLTSLQGLLIKKILGV